jgi:hypothetical protein
MTTSRSRWSRLLPLLCLVPLAGCAVLSDLLAPGLPLQLGLDPATIIPQEGVVLVAYNNTTQSQATFYAFSAVNAQDLTAGSRNFSAVVDAGKQQNEVVDCPVGVVAPGSLDSSFAVQPLAAVVNGTSVDYAGPVLTSGDTFVCGDMIEITLSSTGATTTGSQATYAISVRVVPGR